MKLATLMVLTPDLTEARRFYETILGFEVVSESADLLVLDHEGAAFHVFRCEADAPVVRHGRDAATVAVFAVASIDDAMASLRAKGVEFLHRTPGANRFGRYAAFKAPGGNVHEIFEPDADA
ncbi:VOC family protein [uncultured Phenylobacterium sp.]|uniref:VOC family protein n=1 Tax=uncultured Phenylobacterium sp. TaxID=349273 RepID=UPI0025DC1A50|nr:VOC family protein [uncultured Phenylobacterium sp.]